MLISVPVRPDRAASTHEVVEPEISRTFAAVDHVVSASIVSESYGLPTRTDDDRVDIAVFKVLDGIESPVAVTAGAWPAPGDSLRTVVSESIAGQLGLSVGDEVIMTHRAAAGEQRTVTIAAIYVINDVLNPFWFNDPLATHGVTHSTSFNTFGPFVVDRDTLLRDLTLVSTRFQYRVLVDHESMTVDDLPALITSLRGLEDRLNSAAARLDTDAVGLAQDFLLVSEDGLSWTELIAGHALVIETTGGLVVAQFDNEGELADEIVVCDSESMSTVRSEWPVGEPQFLGAIGNTLILIHRTEGSGT